MNDTKGILATVATPIGVGIAWMPLIESALRIGVSVAGIAAGIYAARYWHLRAKKLKQDNTEE